MMNLSLAGDVLVMMIAFLGYYISWKNQGKQNGRPFAIILLLLLGAMLRIYTSCDFFLHHWDERYHALVAKHLMSHPLKPTLYENPILSYDIRNWAGNHIWLHKQPFALWCMATSMKMFGVNEIALRLPSILISSIGIYLTYYIARYFFSEKAAYIAAFLQSVNGFIIELTAGRDATDHIDIFFLFFIELSIFFTVKYVEKQKTIFNVLAAVGLGIAVLSKWLPALIVLPIWLILVIGSKKFSLKSIVIQFLLLVSLTTCIFLPWQVFIFHAYPAEAHWEAHFNAMHFKEVIEYHSGNWLYYIEKIRVNYGELIYLPLIWFGYFLYKNKKIFKFWVLCIWVIVPLVVFSSAATKMQGYIMFTAPALFIITGAFYEYLSTATEKKQYSVIAKTIQVAIVVLAFRYSLERIKPFQKIDRNPQWVSELKKLNNRHIESGVLFNYPNPIEAMYYTDLTAYEQLPSIEEVKMLLRKNYKILIFDNGSLSSQWHAVDGVEILKIPSCGL